MAALADMLQELTNIPQSDRQRTKQTALLITALQTLAECKAPLLSQLSTLVDKATTLPPQPARYMHCTARVFSRACTATRALLLAGTTSVLSARALVITLSLYTISVPLMVHSP